MKAASVQLPGYGVGRPLGRCRSSQRPVVPGASIRPPSLPLRMIQPVPAAATLAEAFVLADELNATHGRWSRRAWVYAVDNRGLTHFVDPALRPAP
jgi:hypothetical protein